MCDLFGGDGRGEQLAHVCELQHEVDQRAVGGGGEAERPLRCERAHGGLRALDQRQAAAIERLEALQNLVHDLLRRQRNLERLGHVARPLWRAHAHHRSRCLFAQ